MRIVENFDYNIAKLLRYYTYCQTKFAHLMRTIDHTHLSCQLSDRKHLFFSHQTNTNCGSIHKHYLLIFIFNILVIFIPTTGPPFLSSSLIFLFFFTIIKLSILSKKGKMCTVYLLLYPLISAINVFFQQKNTFFIVILVFQQD